MKKPLLIFVMALNLSLAISASAHAFDIGKIIEKTKQSTAASSASTDSGLLKISDSKYIFSRETSPESKWVMLNVVKDGNKEQILLPVVNSRVSLTIYLRNGAGVYEIQVAESASAEKYGSGYFVKPSVKIENIDKRNMSFLLPSELVQSDNAEIIALAKTITAGAVDEMDMIKKIHTYVAQTIKYDYDSYYDGSYATKAFDAITTLKKLTGVCAGYSDLYAALARAVGIRTKVIYGIGYMSKTESGDHAWNEVFINNNWMSVDVTWDSTTGRMFKYFNIPEEVFDQDHQKQTEQAI
ncbi:MAG: transglutaminase domain-containing protein [Rhizobacter sp.]|nr:transglutaminase domain-containing protein [Bacteriovorax sp.]